MKKDKTRMAIFVSPQTHKKLKVRCAKEEKTFDQLLQELVEKK